MGDAIDGANLKRLCHALPLGKSLKSDVLLGSVQTKKAAKITFDSLSPTTNYFYLIQGVNDCTNSAVT